MQLTPPATPRASLDATSSDRPDIYRRVASTKVQATANLLTPPLTPPDSPEVPEATGLVAGIQDLRVASTYQSAPAIKVQERVTQVRGLSDNELSYYLPARDAGVNDMYLHHRFTAPSHKATFTRVLHIWALQLLRHPLLASTIASTGESYDDVRFVHARPANYLDAMKDASARFDFSRALPSASSASTSSSGCNSDIVDTYLNGPRTLGNAALAKLILVAPALYTPPPSPGRASAPDGSYELMLCATHFIGDGMALHTLMNDFYTLLGSDKTVHDLELLIREQLAQPTAVELPKGLEACLPVQTGLQEGAGQVAYDQAESRLIGGQAFPGPKVRKERRTVVPTFAYGPEDTKRILAKCKANGVTIAHAIFALCNIAWTRVNGPSADPCMMYSALNLRPNMCPSANTSFFHLAVGYFNIILPSLLPPIPTSDLLWHRAQSTKAQTIRAVKSPFLVSRSKETMRIRRERAVRWAGIDDGRSKPSDPFVVKRDAIVKAEKGVAQRALMGVSMLGNLDGMYKHAGYGEVVLTSLQTGSRQRSGGLLLFAYTFQSQLWLSLGYDINGFQEGSIEAFWSEVQMLVGEVML